MEYYSPIDPVHVTSRPLPDQNKKTLIQALKLSPIVIIAIVIIMIVQGFTAQRSQDLRSRASQAIGPQTDQAVFVEASSVPTQVKAGSQFFVIMTFKNTGSTTWSDDTVIRLGALPAGSKTWGQATVPVPQGMAVAPGASHAFHIVAQAPREPGVYTFQWQMARDYIKWFGNPSPATIITVTK